MFATAPPAPRPPRRLTARAAVVLGVLVLLGLSAALPLREYLSQRSQIGALEQQQDQARARVAGLEAERVRLNDPAYVAAQARRRFDFVRPGETAYLIIPPSPVPSAGSGQPGAPAPFYGELWNRLRAADRPPSAVPAPVQAAQAPTDATGVPTLAPSPSPAG